MSEGADELLPVDGKDEVYDRIMAEIGELEQELNEQLKKFEKSLGYGVLICNLHCIRRFKLSRCSLSYWHSAIGNKVRLIDIRREYIILSALQEIYLVQTKPEQKNIPNQWTKSGGTKVRFFSYLLKPI